MKSKPPTSSPFDKFTALVDQVLTVKPEQVKYPPLSEERKMADLRYLKKEIEAEERRNSQVIPDETT